MPEQSPAEFIKSLQGSGLLLQRGSAFFFIPVEALKAYECPNVFRPESEGLPTDYFKTVNSLPQGESLDKVVFYDGLEKMLERDFSVVEGVERAIWLDAAEGSGDALESRVEGETALTFKANKILVDLAKGGRPSTGR